MINLAQHTGSHARELREHGYTVIPDALPPPAIAALHDELTEAFTNTPRGSGLFYGADTTRFGRLLFRTQRSQALVMHPLMLALAQDLLGPWCDRIQLNTTQAISVHPGAGAQLPHRDQDMWRGETGEKEYLLNVMWPLTPFTAHNGGTRIWPGSHGPRANEAPPDTPPLVPELEPGSALLFLGSTLHAAGGNLDTAERRGIVIGYSLGWLKPYEAQWLAYPPDVARHFPRELAELVGYAQHRPNLGNFEGQCPSVLLGDYAGEPLGAIDALRPDQQELAEAHLGDAARVS